MKYGFNDMAWDAIKEECGRTNFADGVEKFNREAWRGMMKRKTVTKGELEMLKALTEMVEMLNEEVKNKKVVE